MTREAGPKHELISKKSFSHGPPTKSNYNHKPIGPFRLNAIVTFNWYSSLFYVDQWFGCVCVCVPHMPRAHRDQAETQGSPGTEATVVCWELNLGPLEEQPSQP